MSACGPGKQDSLDVLAQAALTGAEGMPVGVQVATLPWQDELCLSIMKDVEKGVCFDANHERPFLLELPVFTLCAKQKQRDRRPAVTRRIA